MPVNDTPHLNGISPENHRCLRSNAFQDYSVLGSPYETALSRFKGQHLVTIAAGATCAYLGDERSLREFLVADETARHLSRAGHTVIYFLIDDSMDALTMPQLRVAVNKDPRMIEKCESWCGKPISRLPDPFGCHASFAAHFEDELLKRLRQMDCYPTLVSTSRLYEHGVYTPYVRIVLERYNEILNFLHERFSGYKPETLFYPLCPRCGYLHKSTMEAIVDNNLHMNCRLCDQSSVIPFDQVEGKLNWKLDCAARWALFNIDAEPFSKSYLEPQTGSFAVAQALSLEYFGGHEVLPIHYGLVKMENKWSYKLLQSLPGSVLRRMLVENPPADLKLTRDLVMTAASRHEALPGLSYLDFIKQQLPMWVLTPHALTPDQRALLAHGIAFRNHFMDEETLLHLPERQDFLGQPPGVLTALRTLLLEIIRLRTKNPSSGEMDEDDLHIEVGQAIDALGEYKKSALHWLRAVIGQKQGLPASRFVMVLPIDYLKMLEYMLELHLYLHNVNPLDTEPVVERRLPVYEDELCLTPGFSNFTE